MSNLTGTESTRNRCSGSPQRGFTILELMFTVAVAAVLVTVGVPSFNTFLQNTRATTYANDLVLALNLARSEATRRGAPVRVCASADAEECSDSDDWSTGWIVITAADEVLRTWDQRDGGADVVVGQSGLTEVQFEARGSLAAANTVIEIRLPNCTGNQGRDVAVSRTGRVAVTRVDCS
jgi:type IV fimbrial biogenesis protein FimT